MAIKAVQQIMLGTVTGNETKATGERELTSSEWSYTGSDVSVQGFDENGGSEPPNGPVQAGRLHFLRYRCKKGLIPNGILVPQIGGAGLCAGPVQSRPHV